jgi:hypothetical protein
VTTTAPVTTVPGPTTTTVPPTTTTTLPCNLGAFTITTASTGKTYLNKSGTMSESPVLNLAVNGVCALVATVQSVLQGATTADPGAPYTLVGLPAGGQWAVTVAANGQPGWQVGIHNLTVRLAGAPTSVAHGLLVCGWTPPGQRSSSATVC